MLSIQKLFDYLTPKDSYQNIMTIWTSFNYQGRNIRIKVLVFEQVQISQFYMNSKDSYFNVKLRLLRVLFGLTDV